MGFLIPVYVAGFLLVVAAQLGTTSLVLRLRGHGRQGATAWAILALAAGVMVVPLAVSLVLRTAVPALALLLTSPYWIWLLPVAARTMATRHGRADTPTRNRADV